MHIKQFFQRRGVQRLRHRLIVQQQRGPAARADPQQAAGQGANPLPAVDNPFQCKTVLPGAALNPEAGYAQGPIRRKNCRVLIRGRILIAENRG